MEWWHFAGRWEAGDRDEGETVMTVTLQPTDLHWLKRDLNDPRDLCAHSPVNFCVNGRIVVSPREGDWSVNASAVYLLRTLSSSHTKDSPVGDHLFPCCGFTLYDIDGEDVLIVGCPSGIDMEVIRRDELVLITQANGTRHALPFSDWRRAVCEFSDTVRAFYEREKPREPFDEEERKGFRKMMMEWDRRRALASG